MANIKLFEYHHKRIGMVMIGDVPWFVARDVCEVLGIVNVSDAVSSLPEEWKRVIAFTDSVGRPQRMLGVSEAGVYKLAFRSYKPEADRFSNWLAAEVIPAIRRTGRYEYKPQGILPLECHTDEGIQKTMSVHVNAYNFERGGKEAAILYNVANCVAHTGKHPIQVRREGKEAKLKSKDRQSAKAVVRVTNPPIASCMSLADNLCEHGYDPVKVFEVSKQAEKVFAGMLELGAQPAELKD